MSWPEVRKAAAGSQMSSRRLTYSIRIDIGTNGSSWVPRSISQESPLVVQTANAQQFDYQILEIASLAV
jgi:hypothetical protein